MLVYLPVVRRARSKYSRQGDVFRSGSQELGKAPRKIGGALQTEGKQTRRGYSIQDMELPEYIEKCRQITDACGWPENAKDMALRNAILLGLKNPMVYQKCLEENQDTLTADRVIEIATDIYNSDCQRSIMQTLSTASAAATAIQQGSTQVHKLQGNHILYRATVKTQLLE